MNRNGPPPLINPWTVLGAVLIAGCLLIVTLLAIGWANPRQTGSQGFTIADITVIAPPTSTPTAAATALPAGTAAATQSQLAVGAYVQITGTEGAGLRIRSAPGLASETVFRGEESETFQVKDGPRQADGYTWWYVVAPYDTTRAGWAAADYLAVVPAP
jgi:hypothetical protein